MAEKPTESELRTYYADKYYQTQKGGNQKEYTEQEIGLFQAKARQRGAMIQRILGSDAVESLSLLDVGCGEGFELAFFHEKGWKVKGLDFSQDGMRRQNPQCLPYLKTGDIYRLLSQEMDSGNQYDVVWLQNVLEHVLDPEELLKDFRNLVSSHGVAVVTVPNDFSKLQKYALQNRLISKRFWVVQPDHLSYFDTHSLRNIARATGWSCEIIMADFPIDWFLMNDSSNYIEDPVKGKLAHQARIRLESLIHQQDMSEILDFWVALANIGMGRNLTAFLRPHSKNE